MIATRGGLVLKAVLVVLCLLLVGCGQGETDASKPPAASASASAQRGEPILIRTRVHIAAEEGAEVIATGEVLDGSTLGGSPFCVGGTILDSHGSTDPQVWLIARTITCPGGSVRMDLTPGVPQGLTQMGSWSIVSGTGDFEGLTGSGQAEIAYDEDPAKPARETHTGSASR